MTKNILQWTINNKMLVFFAFSTFCLLISTVTLAQKSRELCASNTYGLIKNNPPGGYIQHIKEDDLVHDDDFYRLPKNVKPSHYDLYFSPSISNKTFKGNVIITLNVIEQTKLISLHLNNLTVNDIQLENIFNNKNVSIKSTEIVKDKRELLFVLLEKKISKGNYKLSIQFDGRLDRGIVGFYSSSLKNGGSMVASKFQPTYARQAFPCFDEPDFKATYSITLVKPKSYVALSNMNEISRTVDEDTNNEVVRFAKSVPMSTYLACFVICDFDYKETEINANSIGNNFILRSFAQKGETHKIDFAQDIGKRATEFYINYYEVPFPLPKLDMIAIPDYVSGATEHWGLITYRETSFLVDSSTASSKNKISVANTIAHELAHMWFGNLVTMKWWDEVWLNEGFASYMQVKALNHIEPSWTMLDQFLTKTLHSVLNTDAKLSSHPIVQNVATPDQITAIFDSISYNKGASVLRMLEGFIGEENFRRGVSDYLKKYKFDNTITQDLLSSLEPYFKKENANLNLTYIMDTWTRQMGYPLLTLVASEENPRSFVVTQSRFLLDPEAKYPNDSQFNYRWFVPITYKTNQEQNKNIVWFPDTANNVQLTLKEGETWLKINNNQVGYYRVNYPIVMWQNLIQQLHIKSPQLTISDRAHLLNDVFALAEARVVPYDLALNLTTYFTVEEDYVPWEAANLVLGDLASKLLNSLSHNDFEKYVQRLVKPLYNKQNWDVTNIGVIEGLLRTRILSMAVRYQLPEAVAKVRSMFLNWLNNHSTSNAVNIQPDLRDFVYFYGMKAASQSEWEKLWQIYLKEKDVQESTKIRSALAAPHDTSILRRYLTLAWDETNIRSQDYLNVIVQIAGNPSGTALVWDDVRSRWPQLVDRFTLNSRYLSNVIPGITGSFNTELKLKEVETFFEQYPEAGAGEAARRRALETIRNNIRWANTHKPSVAAWLHSQH